MGGLSFNLDDDQLAIREMARTFATERLAPSAIERGRRGPGASYYLTTPGHLALTPGKRSGAADRLGSAFAWRGCFTWSICEVSAITNC